MILNSSPDLTPLDFFLWSHLKNKIYETEPASPEEVIREMGQAIGAIDGAMLRRVHNDIILRAEACIEARGGHIKNFL